MSLKKIAEMTGASPATVSRVLNHPEHRCHDAALAERIRQAARELNYIPNDTARQLKKGGSTSLRIFRVDVLLARFDSLEEDSFFVEVYRHLEKEFLNQGCILGRILNVPDISRIEAARERTRSDGLVILGKYPERLLDILYKRYRGIVAIDRNPSEYKFDEVVCSGFHASTAAVEYLISLGHKKIAYIGDCNMESRYSGYYECLLKYKIPMCYNYVVSTGQTRQEGYAAYDRLCQPGCQPSAVFCANDVTALGFLQAMKDYNGHKRQQVYRPAVISIDDIEEAASFSPMLTTMHIPKEDMAHLAVMLLKDRLLGNHTESVRMELPCQLMVRESSGVHVY